MVSHAAYPKLEAKLAKKSYCTNYEYKAAKELEKIGLPYSEYRKWVVSRPASFSPSIIRGFLRQELGFKGIVAADALNMGAIRDNVQRLLKTIQKRNLEAFQSTNRRRARPFATLANILSIYAGIEYFLIAWAEGDAIFKYAENSPYFQECVNEAFEKHLWLLKRVGYRRLLRRAKYKKALGSRSADSVNEKIRILRNNEAFPFWGSQDPWDRGGVLHRYFRSWYLRYLYDDERLTQKKFREVFWRIHQKTNWVALDPLFQKTINGRYS